MGGDNSFHSLLNIVFHSSMEDISIDVADNSRGCNLLETMRTVIEDIESWRNAAHASQSYSRLCEKNWIISDIYCFNKLIFS